MFIGGCNEVCKNIRASYLNVGDEFMSAFRFWTKAKGDLPHLSYIFSKPDPMGTEFKTVACYVTGSLQFVEVQIVKKGMSNSKYQNQLGSTAVCTKRMTEATKGRGQRDIKRGYRGLLSF